MTIESGERSRRCSHYEYRRRTHSGFALYDFVHSVGLIFVLRACECTTLTLYNVEDTLLLRDASVYENPPLGVAVIRVFQEVHSSEKKFKSQITRRETSKDEKRSIASINFVLNSIPSCSIDLVLQVFIFPYLSICREVFTS